MNAKEQVRYFRKYQKLVADLKDTSALEMVQKELLDDIERLKVFETAVHERIIEIKIMGKQRGELIK